MVILSYLSKEQQQKQYDKTRRFESGGAKD